MEIRRATADDEAVMRSLWDEFTAEATYTPYPGSPFSASLVADHLAFLAEDAGTPAGCVYAATPSEHFGFVFGLYVRPPARRRGLARRLMRTVGEALRAEGRRYVLLSVDTPNAAAQALYDNLGFTESARTLRADIDELLKGR
jgi:ribosomal protein S18 acetylase RimI-like enzyme